MKPFDLCVHALLQTHVIKCAAHDAEALTALVVTHAPQLVLGALVHDTQLMNQTRSLVKQEREGRGSSATILLDQVLLEGVETLLDFEEELLFDYLEALEFHFTLYGWDILDVSCKMLNVHELEVLLKA